MNSPTCNLWQILDAWCGKRRLHLIVGLSKRLSAEGNASKLDVGGVLLVGQSVLVAVSLGLSSLMMNAVTQ
jgi:hypothetical protein